MEKAELYKLAEYVTDVNYDLFKHEYDANGMQVELGQLHRTIKRLMDESAIEPSPKERAKLAEVEHMARKCRDRMLELTAVKN